MVGVNMSMENEKSNRRFAARLIFDVSLVLGVLTFSLVLWGVPSSIKMLQAIFIGLITFLISFAICIWSIKTYPKLVNNRFFNKWFPSSRQSNNKKNLNQNSDLSQPNDLSYSIHSLSNYEPNPDKRVKQPTLETTLPSTWSAYLIEAIEWRIFDRLCVAFWRSQGNQISGIAERSHDGIDFFVSAPKQKRFRIGVVQTRSALSTVPTIDDMRDLLLLRDNNKLSIAILMYAGKLSNVTHSFCVANDIRLIDANSIALGLKSLKEKEQKHLLKSLIRPDYMIPSCPRCRIKLVKRQTTETGRLFWGCVSYPECRFTIDTT